MGFRFRKVLSLGSLFRVNLSRSGASVSIGPRGASVTIGKRGTHAHLGIPGTGLSYTTRLDKPPARRKRGAPHSKED